ncbi:MAG: gamma-glutamyl-gamma-aminobutyrate hydrolase family protein [bacterium]|jgi:GMP synthase-like glutamine amidotransferase
MILYVIMETAEKYLAGNWQRPRLTLEETSGDYCLMIHYKQLNLKMLSVLRPRAIVYSGSSTPFEEYDVRQTRNYRQVVMTSAIPQLGICAGQQLAAEFFGCTLGIMHLLSEEEADHNPKYHPGEYKEWGVYPVTILQKDPLFDGLGKIVRVQQFHRSEIKGIGSEVIILASSKACQVQAFRHRTKPFYGVQFHPEEACEGYSDGFKILSNFFKWAAARQK